MKIWIVWKDLHDESLIEEIFMSEKNAKAHLKICKLGADKYTCYYIVDWDVKP